MECDLCPYGNPQPCEHNREPAAIVPFIPRKTKPKPKVKSRLRPGTAKMLAIEAGKWCDVCDTPFDPHHLCAHLRAERFERERAEVHDWLTHAERWAREENSRGVREGRIATSAMRRACFRAGRDVASETIPELPIIAAEAIAMRTRTGALLKGTKPLSTPGGDEIPF